MLKPIGSTGMGKIKLPIGDQPAVFAELIKYEVDNRERIAVIWQLEAQSRTGEGLRRIVHGELIPASTSPGSRFRDWMVGFLGSPGLDARELTTSVLHTPEKLVGKSCVLNIVLNDSGRLHVKSIRRVNGKSVPLQEYVRPLWIGDILDRITREKEILEPVVDDHSTEPAPVLEKTELPNLEIIDTSLEGILKI